MPLSRLAMPFAVVAGLSIATMAAPAAEPEDTLIMTLKDGEVIIALRPDLAPKHVGQIKALVREGAYDGVAFHRVIEGFMAQTGDVEFGGAGEAFDPARVGTGGSERGNIAAEFSSQPFVRGTVGMARAQHPDSANSQFFIMFAPAPNLDGAYTVVGEVESGMEWVDRIKRGDPASNGMVTDPDRMVDLRILADSN